MNNNIELIEERVAVVFFVLTTIMVLIGAIGRSLGYPITASVDLAMLFFAWTCCIGADLAMRRKSHILIDVMIKNFSVESKKKLAILWQVVIAAFLGLLIFYSIKLSLKDTAREIGDTGLSYLLVNASLPVGCLLMLITTITDLNNYLTGKAIPSLVGRDGESL